MWMATIYLYSIFNIIKYIIWSGCFNNEVFLENKTKLKFLDQFNNSFIIYFIYFLYKIKVFSKKFHKNSQFFSKCLLLSEKCFTCQACFHSIVIVLFPKKTHAFNIPFNIYIHFINAICY